MPTKVARLTGLSQRLVVERCLSNLERAPFFPLELFIYVDDIKMLVLEEDKSKSLTQVPEVTVQSYYHPKFMAKVTHEDGPVLRWVRIRVDSVGDHFPNHSLLGKPFSCHSRNRMPPNLHGAVLAVELGLGRRNDIGSVAESNRLL